MKIREKCPGCGATHDVDSQSIKRIRIYCGCNQHMLDFDARIGKIKWRIPHGMAAARRRGIGPPIVRGHTSGGNVVPKDIANKWKMMYGSRTVTGRTPSKGGPVQIKDSADGELRFIDSKELTWPKDGFKWDLVSPTEGEKKFPGKARFEGHGAPDKRSELVRQFQDVFGRDQ